jgi:hypothetical protein
MPLTACSQFTDRIVSLTDHHQRLKCRWFCLLSRGWHLIPLQRRPLPSTLRALALEAHRIIDRELVLKLSRASPRPALDHMQILPRTLKISLRTEVRHIDDESIPLPMAARLANHADTGRQMRAPVPDNVPLPLWPLAHVVEHRCHWPMPKGSL